MVHVLWYLTVALLLDRDSALVYIKNFFKNYFIKSLFPFDSQIDILHLAINILYENESFNEIYENKKLKL